MVRVGPRQADRTVGSDPAGQAEGGITGVSDAAAVQKLENQVAELRAEVNGLTAELTEVATAMSADMTSAPTSLELQYKTLDDWVRGYFLPTFSRPIGGEIRWCDEWREHAEAITRLEALWRSWEHLRLEPALGMATWLTNHLDPQLAAIHSRSGTFAQCQPERHAPSDVAPPSGLCASP
jgi:hypothetical protein